MVRILAKERRKTLPILFPSTSNTDSVQDYFQEILEFPQLISLWQQQGSWEANSEGRGQGRVWVVKQSRLFAWGTSMQTSHWDGSTSQCFNFTMTWKWCPFSRNCTSEFWFSLFLPSKWYMVGHSLVMQGSGSHCSSQSALQSWEQRTGNFSTVLNMDAHSVFHFQHTNQ